jgi:hypothetical protein
MHLRCVKAKQSKCESPSWLDFKMCRNAASLTKPVVGLISIFNNYLKVIVIYIWLKWLNAISSWLIRTYSLQKLWQLLSACWNMFCIFFTLLIRHHKKIFMMRPNNCNPNLIKYIKYTLNENTHILDKTKTCHNLSSKPWYYLIFALLIKDWLTSSLYGVNIHTLI